jgi:hypothetical protein
MRLAVLSLYDEVAVGFVHGVLLHTRTSTTCVVFVNDYYLISCRDKLWCLWCSAHRPSRRCGLAVGR